MFDKLELGLRVEYIIAACGHVALRLKHDRARNLGFECAVQCDRVRLSMSLRSTSAVAI